MKIALFGNGKMGQLVATQARAAGHEIGEVINSDTGASSSDELAARLRAHDVAIDFTVAGGGAERCRLRHLKSACEVYRMAEGHSAIFGRDDREAAWIYGANFRWALSFIGVGGLANSCSEPAITRRSRESLSAKLTRVGTSLAIPLLKEGHARDSYRFDARGRFRPHRVGFYSAPINLLTPPGRIARRIRIRCAARAIGSAPTACFSFRKC